MELPLEKETARSRRDETGRDKQLTCKSSPFASTAKAVVVGAYCRRLIPASFAQWLFTRFPGWRDV